MKLKIQPLCVFYFLSIAVFSSIWTCVGAFLALLILGVSLLASFFYARWITRPIVDISHIAARIAGLNFSSRWAQHRTDEIGALGDSLNTLSDNLSGALTELKAANERLQQDMERERDMERQRSAFFSAASHELKTPVTILKGQLSGMLAQIGVYRDRDKYLARALQVTGRMESLIKEILIISRIEAGSFVLKTDTVNLSEMMERQLELDEELLAQKGLHIEKHMASDVTIRGNQDLLTNALDNVLMNAILYSPQAASIRILLDAHTMTIENTGVSIPEALHAVLPRGAVPQPSIWRERTGAVSGQADSRTAQRLL